MRTVGIVVSAMCEVTMDCKADSKFWLQIASHPNVAQRNVVVIGDEDDPRNITACGTHLARAIRNMSQGKSPDAVVTVKTAQLYTNESGTHTWKVWR